MDTNPGYPELTHDTVMRARTHTNAHYILTYIIISLLFHCRNDRAFSKVIYLILFKN